MSTITFDTLKFVDRLVEAGMPEKHAKALAQAQAEINETNLQDIVSNSDLHEMNAQINVQIGESDARINVQISELDVRIRELDARIREMDARINGRLNLLTWMLALVIITTAIPLIKSIFS